MNGIVPPFPHPGGGGWPKKVWDASDHGLASASRPIGGAFHPVASGPSSWKRDRALRGAGRASSNSFEEASWPPRPSSVGGSRKRELQADVTGPQHVAGVDRSRAGRRLPGHGQRSAARCGSGPVPPRPASTWTRAVEERELRVKTLSPRTCAAATRASSTRSVRDRGRATHSGTTRPVSSPPRCARAGCAAMRKRVGHDAAGVAGVHALAQDLHRSGRPQAMPRSDVVLHRAVVVAAARVEAHDQARGSRCARLQVVDVEGQVVAAALLAALDQDHAAGVRDALLGQELRAPSARRRPHSRRRRHPRPYSRSPSRTGFQGPRSSRQPTISGCLS